MVSILMFTVKCAQKNHPRREKIKSFSLIIMHGYSGRKTYNPKTELITIVLSGNNIKPRQNVDDIFKNDIPIQENQVLN